MTKKTETKNNNVLMDRVEEIFNNIGAKADSKKEDAPQLPSVFADKKFFDKIKKKYPKVEFEDFLCIVALSEGMTLVKAGCTYMSTYKKYTNSKDAPGHVASAVRFRLQRINGYELLQDIREKKWEMGNHVADIADDIVSLAKDKVDEIMTDDGYDAVDKMKSLQIASKIANDRMNVIMRDKELNAKKEMGVGGVTILQGGAGDVDLKVLNEDGSEKEVEIKNTPTIVVFNGSN